MLQLMQDILHSIFGLLMVEPFNYFVGLAVLCGIVSIIHKFK